jgi:hypothetical protein
MAHGAWRMVHGVHIAKGITIVLKLTLYKIHKKQNPAGLTSPPVGGSVQRTHVMSNTSTISPMPHAPCPMQKNKLFIHN